MDRNMAWLLLFAAGAVEVAMALALKYAEGWTRPLPSTLGVLAALASIWLLTLSLRSLPAATAYAVWTGIGAVGVTLLGLWLFGESAAPRRLACIALIVAGVIGLRLLET